jgi:hypothetical protein
MDAVEGGAHLAQPLRFALENANRDVAFPGVLYLVKNIRTGIDRGRFAVAKQFFQVGPSGLEILSQAGYFSFRHVQVLLRHESRQTVWRDWSGYIRSRDRRVTE